MVQCRLTSLFFDQVKRIQFNLKKCVIIGIINQIQLAQLNPMACCPDIVNSVIVIPKLDKKRRFAILQKSLSHSISIPNLERLDEETASYSAADLNSLCSFCLQSARGDSQGDSQMDRIFDYLLSQKSSISRQFNSVKPLEGGFQALIGMDAIKQSVRENIILPLLNWSQYSRLHLQPPSGCLFYGPSGCGKTAIIQALAYELRNRVELIEVTCTDLLSKV